MPPSSTVTAFSRMQEFSEDFFADNGKLMCHFCDHSINFQTKNTVTAHIGSKTHIRNKKMKIEQTKTRQPTIQTINKILDDDRQNLNPESLKSLTMMYFNNQNSDK